MKSLKCGLLKWYRAVRRDLPWRRTRDPYSIWLSESMLQQTRVETVIPYYERFLDAFPTVRDLAAADQHDVLRLWAGLGYYARARNLHAAAKCIVAKHGGTFPRSAAGLAELPGVGRYTANAVASIAFQEPVAVLDGNVKRVLARMFLFERPINASASQTALWSLAEEFLDRSAAGDFNQALMELGATICVPRRPACQSCPLKAGCAAFMSGRQDELPRKIAKKTTPVLRGVALAVWRKDKLLLLRRPQTGLLAGLWELPGAVESTSRRGREFPKRRGAPRALRAQTSATSPAAVLKTLTGLSVARPKKLGEVRHVFTHRDLTLDVFAAESAAGRMSPIGKREAAWVAPTDFPQHAMSTLDRKVLAVALAGRAGDSRESLPHAAEPRNQPANRK